MNEQPPPATAGRWRRLVVAKLAAVRAKTEQTGGRNSPGSIADSRGLAARLDVPEEHQPGARRKRWPVALALALTLAAASILLFLRVPRTEIELEASVSELAFRLSAEQALTQTAQLRFLGIAGIEGIDLPTGFDAIPGQDSMPAHALAIHASASDTQCQGSITLDRMILPRDARIWLRQPNSAHGVQMSSKAAGAVIHVTVDGCVRVGSASGAPWPANGARTLAVRLGTDEVDLDLEVAPGARVAFEPFVRANDVTFTRVDRVARDNVTLVRYVSTIKSGTLYYQSLDGEERKLRFAEPIRFARSDGELRSIEVDQVQIAIRFHGDVSAMASGTEKHARSLMPTYLEWLKANHSLSLLWATALYAFGVVMSLLKWWTRES